MSELFNKHKQKINYLFFGGCTTLINTAVYYICYENFELSNIPSNVFAWIAAALFAYVTNKIWVFESNSADVKTLLKELSNFFGCRMATALLDLTIMIVSVDLLKWNALIMKIVANLIVIILNYVLSKLIVFKNDQDSNSS